MRAEGGPFRILPAVARGAGALVARFPGQVLAAGLGLLLVACAAIPSMQVARKLESVAEYDDPAFVGQRLLSSRFGLEGAPLVLLVEGDEQDVLTRTAALQVELDSLRRAGRLRAVFSPTSLVPSPGAAALPRRGAPEPRPRRRGHGAGAGHRREWLEPFGLPRLRRQAARVERGHAYLW